MWWVFNATLRPLYPREWPGTLCTGGWVSHRAGLDGCGKTRPHRNSIPGPSIPQKVAALTKLSCRHVVCKLKVDLVHAIQGSEEDEISFKPRRLYHRRMCSKHPLNWSLFGPPVSIRKLGRWQKCLVLSEMEPWFLGFGGGAQSLHRQVIPSPHESIHHRTVL